jgi:hypothetical protein
MSDEGSGITGLIITAIIYFAAFVVSCLFLYEYLVKLHKNARIVDIWRRINAEADEFFLPDDYEVTMDELTSVMNSAKTWRGLDGSTRIVQVLSSPNSNPDSRAASASGSASGDARTNAQSADGVSAISRTFASSICVKHFAVYELSADQKKWTLHRHFMLMSNGSVVEIFQQFRSDQRQGESSLASLLSEALDEFIRRGSDLMAQRYARGAVAAATGGGGGGGALEASSTKASRHNNSKSGIFAALVTA